LFGQKIGVKLRWRVVGGYTVSRCPLNAALCFCSLVLASCASKQEEAQALRAQLEASRAENARLQHELDALKSKHATALPEDPEEEFVERGDFRRINSAGQFEFSYRKVFVRPPELVIEAPPTQFRFEYFVSERRLDGFTISVAARSYDSEEYMKAINWQVKGVVRKTAK
jgi:hypothetical protein